MLKKMGSSAVTLLILLGIGAGCREDSDNPAPDDAAYFPLQVGDYWVYQVTQETYATPSPAVNQAYQLQQKISSSYHQNGQLLYLVEESVRQTGQSAWTLSGIHTLYENLSEVVGQENNVPVIQLTFPITAATSWNANAYNTNSDTPLQYQAIGASFAVGTLGFANTVSVTGTNDSTLVNQEKHRRVYAQNVGLVYGEDWSLAFCQSSPACVGKGIIESGTKRKWELLASNRLP